MFLMEVNPISNKFSKKKKLQILKGVNYLRWIPLLY